MSLVFNPVGSLLGPTGLSVLNGKGAPDPNNGRVGESYLDTDAGRLYPAKTAQGWSSAYLSLVGPPGQSTPQTLPQDFNANSFLATPQAGDQNPVRLALTDAQNNTKFLVDAQGNTTAAGNASFAGTLGVAGQTNLARVVAASAQVTGNQGIGGNLTVTGTATVGSLSTGGFTNSGDETITGKLTVQGATTLAALAAASANVTGNVTVGGTFGVSGATTLGATTVASLNDTGNAAVGGNLTVTGQATLGALSAQSLALSGNLTVQGTSTLGQTSTGALTATSINSTGTTQSTGHFVTSNGTAGAPAFSFVSQPDTGMFLATASNSAAVLGFTVNGTQSLALARGGASVAGTLSATGAAVLGSTLAVTGAITGSSSLTVNGPGAAQTFAVAQGSSTDTSGNLVAAVKFPGVFGGTQSYPASGIASDGFGNLIFTYQGRSVMAFANPGYNSQAGTTPATAFGINFTAGAYTFGAGGATALLIGANGSVTIGGGASGNSFPCIITQQAGTLLSLRQGANVVGTFDAAGNATLTNVVTAAGFTLSATGTKVTFGDGSVQTTAYTSTAANNQPKWIATAQGTTAAPAFTFSANADTGMYLKASGATGAALGLSVNATDALLLTSGGASVPGTFGVTGATNVAALTASALVKATAFTITASGGAITFGDGTTQTTAAAGAGAAGSAAKFTATSPGTSAAPAFTFTGNTDSGLSLPVTGTAANVSLSVNSVSVFNAYKGVAYLPISTTAQSTLQVMGSLAANAGITLSGGGIVANGNSLLQVGGGSATAPTLAAYNNTNTGIFFGNGTGTASRVFVSVNGVQTATFSSTGQFTATDAISGTQFSGQTYASTNPNGSTGGVQFGIANTTGLYVNTATSGNPVVGLSQGGSVLLSGNNNGLLVPVQSSFTATATHSATVTSTTAAGTPSFVSSQGFRHNIWMGTYYTYSGTAVNAPTSDTPLTQVVTAQNGAPASMKRPPAMPFNGSVVALSVYTNGSLTASQTATFTVYVNGVATTLQAKLANGTSAPVDATNYTPVTKNTVSFSAGQTVAVYVKFADPSANTAVGADVWVEMGA